MGTGQGRLGRTGQRYQKLDFDKPCELSLEFGIYSKLWKGFKQKNNRITFLRKFILKHTEGCPVSLYIREMQIRITRSYHFTLRNKCCRGSWKNQSPHTLMGKMENDAAIWEASLAVLQKVKTELPYDPAIPPLDI